MDDVLEGDVRRASGDGLGHNAAPTLLHLATVRTILPHHYDVFVIEIPNTNASNMIEEHNKYYTNTLLKAHTMDTLQTLQQMRYKKNIVTHVYQVCNKFESFLCWSCNTFVSLLCNISEIFRTHF